MAAVSSVRLSLLARIISITAAALLFVPTALPNKKPPLQPVDINRASAAELKQVPGIGPALAETIVHMREKSGPFKKLEELLVIRGISHKRLEQMRAYLTVRPLTVKPKK